MKIHIQIYRLNPENKKPGKLIDYTVKIQSGMSVLDLLHQVHDEQDGSLAYRYSCRGAICGTCAIKINGSARLACKTQVSELLQDNETIILEPLANMGVIKDLVVDQRPFWETIKGTMPWLVRESDSPDERITYETALDKFHQDQFNRAADCIKCGSCYSDCPKVEASSEFIGPAASIQIYKQMFDPRDIKTDHRIKISAAKGGVFDCDKQTNCVKVCPKDCRPLRAITFIKNRIKR